MPPKTTISVTNEQRPPRNSRNNRKKASKGSEVIKETVVRQVPSTVVDIVPSQPTARRSSRKKRSIGSRLSRASQAFVQAILYPDITGPIQFPTFGASDRSILGMDHSSGSLLGDSTYTVQAFMCERLYATVGYSYRATGSTTNLILDTSLPPGIQFPTTAQTEELVLTSGCLILQYTGPDDCDSGEILIGNYMSDVGFGSNQFSFNTLYYQPGWVTLSVQELKKKGCIRVPFLHQSADSWDMQPPTAQFKGLSLPVIVTRNLVPAVPSTSTVQGRIGASLTIEVYRNYECHSSLSTSALPYEHGDRSFSSDLAAFQNALADLTEVPLPFTTGWPTRVQDLLPEWDSVKHWAGKGIEMSIPFIVRAALGNRFQSVKSKSGLSNGITLDDVKLINELKERRKRKEEIVDLNPPDLQEKHNLAQAVEDIEDELYKLLTPRTRAARLKG